MSRGRHVVLALLVISIFLNYVDRGSLSIAAPLLEKELALSLLDAGSKLGPALGTFLGGVLLARTGWRIFFVAMGAASLVWLLPWMKWMPRGEGAQRAAAGGLLLVSCAAFGVYTSNDWAITQTLAGQREAGHWTSLQNGVGNLSGIAAAWLTGALVQSTGRFWLAFVTAAGVALAGAALWRVTVRELKEVAWEEGAS